MLVRIRWPVLAFVTSVVVLYAAYPYVTLYRLGAAIQRSDAKTLESLVNWPAVREGIKEDVCDLVIDQPGEKAGSSLPQFGASFMRGIASSSIDRAVTPQALLAAATPLDSEPAQTKAAAPPAGADVHVNWAFFDSPAGFQVSLQARGQNEPIKLEMELRRGLWRVQRVWLPAELLSNSGSPT